MLTKAEMKKVLSNALSIYCYIKVAKSFRDKYISWAGREHNEYAVDAINVLIKVAEKEVKRLGKEMNERVANDSI